MFSISHPKDRKNWIRGLLTIKGSKVRVVGYASADYSKYCIEDGLKPVLKSNVVRFERSN